MSDRAALRAILVTGPLLIVAGVVLVLSIGDVPLLGTNLVKPEHYLAHVRAGGELCTAAPQPIPSGTGRIVVRVRPARAGLAARLLTAGRTVARGTRGRHGSGDVYVPIGPTVRRATRAVVCLRNEGPGAIWLSGAPADPAGDAVVVDGRRQAMLPMLAFRGSYRVSWWSRIGGVADRFGSAKAGFIGPWALWAAAFLALAAIGTGLLLMARAERSP
jgi:hypothetical protein